MPHPYNPNCTCERCQTIKWQREQADRNPNFSTSTREKIKTLVTLPFKKRKS